MEPSVHGTEGVDGGLVTVFALMVKETRSRVTVLWQDGTKDEHIDATTLIPYLNIDEYDCWYVDTISKNPALCLTRPKAGRLRAA